MEKIFVGKTGTRGWKGLLIVGGLALALVLPGASWGATFAVTTGADDGAGSLRQALKEANAAGGEDTIDIEASIKEIAITKSLYVQDDVVINGSGATLKGAGTHRLVDVLEGSAKFNDLTFTRGAAYYAHESGGAVRVNASLAGAEFVNCTFFGNTASQYGGAVYLYGENIFQTYFTNCTIAGNTADQGGGVAIAGGGAVFKASIVLGNCLDTDDKDIYAENVGFVNSSSQWNVIGKTNKGEFFLESNNNRLSIDPAKVFKTPTALTTVDGSGVLVLLSATSNPALDAIPQAKAEALGLPRSDQRHASRPQMTAVDSGAYELSPLALSQIKLQGSLYVQKGRKESYKVNTEPLDATLDVRGYTDGLVWTVAAQEILSVDAYGNAEGLAEGQTLLYATAHGWDAAGIPITRTASLAIEVGLNPLPAPSITLSFSNPKAEMALGERHTLNLQLDVQPRGTLYEVRYSSDNPAVAAVSQEGSTASSASVVAEGLGKTIVRALVTARNSTGSATREIQYELTVVEKSVAASDGGGGCNNGWGLAVWVLGAAWILGRARR